MATVSVASSFPDRSFHAFTSNDITSSMKRSTESTHPAPKKKQKRRHQITAEDIAMRPLMTLNEICPGLPVSLKEGIVDSRPTFYAEIRSDKATYFGEGYSKKQAKGSAAGKVLEAIKCGRFVHGGKRISFEAELEGSEYSNDVALDSFTAKTFVSSEAAPKLPNLGFLSSKVDLVRAQQFPVVEMLRLDPNIRMTVQEATQGKGYEAEAFIGNFMFRGKGRSKKIARTNLSKSFLRTAFGIIFPKEKNLPVAPSESSKDGEEVSSAEVEKIPTIPAYPPARVKYFYPSMVLTHEECTDISSDSDPPLKTFKAHLKVENLVFEAVKKTKAAADIAVAKQALAQLKTPQPEKAEYVVHTANHPTVEYNKVYMDHPMTITGSGSSPENMIFTASVSIQEEEPLTATGKSKKIARLNLARQVFKRYHGIEESSWAEIPCGADNLEPVKSLSPETKESRKRKLSMPDAQNHPVSLFVRLYPSAVLKFDDISEKSEPQFKASVTIDGQEYSASGRSKKLAKLMLCTQILQEVQGMSIDLEDSPQNETVQLTTHGDLPTEVGNAIHSAVNAKLDALNDSTQQQRVAAAFILEDRTKDYPAFEVISIGTGTKCVSGDMLDATGRTVNDCHGEIIARRGFCHFLLAEIQKCLRGQASVVEKLNKFRLKSNFVVYLYISTAPCGDGRLFSFSGGTPNKSAGGLRSKIENSQGTIPTHFIFEQTSDGILEGDRLRTMSCSDKILKWNVVGVQGALLSTILNPVYLGGIVIGSLYNHAHVERALVQRASSIGRLPDPFVVCRPLFGKPLIERKRATSAATSLSINWNTTESTVEVLEGATGKTLVGSHSRLSKKSFFQKISPFLAHLRRNSAPMTYKDFKALSYDYQQAKQCLFRYLFDCNHGRWIGKPEELDMFV